MQALALMAVIFFWQAPVSALECVPYARDVSGIDIRGDAHTWWQSAAGIYQRGGQPLQGAVMVFRPQGAMNLGHVAVVSRIVDSRTVLLDHANWSTINGQRGQIERGVKAVDVSARGDWSEVRVWYAPIGDLGTTHYPIYGFIYPGAAPSERGIDAPVQIARAPVPPAPDREDPIADLLERLGQ